MSSRDFTPVTSYEELAKRKSLFQTEREKLTKPPETVKPEGRKTETMGFSINVGKEDLTKLWESTKTLYKVKTGQENKPKKGK